MHFSDSRRFVTGQPDFPDATLSFVSPIASTNDWFHTAGKVIPEFSVVVSDEQTSGRGRLGRSWQSPKQKSLALSVLLRPAQHGLEPQAVSWLPLMVGLAAVQALNETAATFGAPADLFALKWPNDVLVAPKHVQVSDRQSSDLLNSGKQGASRTDSPDFAQNLGSFPELNTNQPSQPSSIRKISGVLSELLSDGSVILGVGINLLLEPAELPISTATSLSLELQRANPALTPDAFPAPETLFDEVTSGFLSRLADHYRNFIDASGDAQVSGLKAQLTHACATIGQQVRVELPNQEPLIGTAVDIGDRGELLIRANQNNTHENSTHENLTLHRVFAGDITHLRPLA